MTFPVEACEALDAGVCLLDESLAVVEANARAAELLRRPREGFLGADAHDLLHRDAEGGTTPRSVCRLLEALAAGVAEQGDDGWYACGDGTVRPVHWIGVPCRTGGGRTGAVLVFHPRRPGAAGPADASSSPADRLALLAETTTVLTSTLDVEEALKRLVRLVTPRLADWAVADLLGEGDELRRVAVVHHEGGDYVSMEQFEGPMPPVSHTSRMPLSRVLRGAPPTLVTPEDYRGRPDSGVAEVQRDLFLATGMESAVIAPLRGPHGVLGALTVARGRGRPVFVPADLTLVDDIARRAGLAVDNARLYERQRHVVESMQRHLLPPLPQAAGQEMAARYLPAPHGSHVGGDWYDAFLVQDADTVVVIGDVVGHDLAAAAGMSQLRNILRAYAWLPQASPGEVLDRLDACLPHISDISLATLILARVRGDPDGGSWRMEWANAGHPPPLLVSPDGRTRFLEDGLGVLVGTGLGEGHRTAAVTLPPDTTLVLYTDGLVESPELPLEDGMDRLARHAAALVRRPLESFCDHLVAAVRPAGHTDDVALLTLRTPGRLAAPQT
ncbi:SpoIIE family protein phosphatase [Streptomyces sp. JJ36]|uniref:SpoIIE family protein phosphatase n=1 Tax=Streptomyces sp. JJ36 TaxID=2736645 RepID=UPI001F013135|nr:SpoIIE family protein phosphatase [Streptomyces sp. JJ36]MCF6521494.1 SpoIIE family protein phosphatase [Streptomyces sp. JJ36]